MHSFLDLHDATLQWRPALRWKRHFELRESNLLYASLSWEKASGALVVARAADEIWVIDRADGATPDLRVRRSRDGAEEARFQADWTRGGRLRTSEGEVWAWGSLGPSVSAWSFRAVRGTGRLDVTLEGIRLAPTGRLRFHDGLERAPVAPLLACVGWYLVVGVVDDASLMVPAFAAAE